MQHRKYEWNDENNSKQPMPLYNIIKAPTTLERGALVTWQPIAVFPCTTFLRIMQRDKDDRRRYDKNMMLWESF